jgi:hypothetical protein
MSMSDQTPQRSGIAAGMADSGPYSKAELEALRYMGNPNNPQSQPFNAAVRGQEKIEWPRTGIFDIGTESQIAQRSIAQVRVLGERAPVSVDLRALADKVRDHMPQDPKEQEAYFKNLTEGRTFDVAKHEARKAALHAERDKEDLAAGKEHASAELNAKLTQKPAGKKPTEAKPKGFDKIKGDQAAAAAKTPEGRICGAFASTGNKPVDCAAVDKAAVASPAIKDPGTVKVKTVKIGPSAKLDLGGFY